MLAAARLARLKAQHLSTGRNVERCACRSIRDANDDGELPAMPEEMLHGQRNEAVRDVAAEDADELLESFDEDGLVQRPALGASDERYDRRCDDRDDFCTGLGVR